jgi:hypothetical protein
MLGDCYVQVFMHGKHVGQLPPPPKYKFKWTTWKLIDKLVIGGCILQKLVTYKSSFGS